jgi:enoyl-CoA hydratase
MIDAKEAYRIGLFDELAEPDELMDKAKEIAHKIMKNAPLSVARAKYSVDRGADLPLDIAIDLESQIWAEMFGTADQKEGMAGFIEKREKSFTGK